MTKDPMPLRSSIARQFAGVIPFLQDLISMKPKGIVFEKSEYGTRAILTAPITNAAKKAILRARPEELELNTAKGWHGEDIDFVSSFPWLRSFLITHMNADNIDPVHSLQNLVNLSVMTYCNTAIDFSAFPKLKRCGLEWRARSRSLFECRTLERLFVNHYKGKSIEPFTNLSRLGSLTLLTSPISDLRGIGKLKHLKKLRLGNLRNLKTLDGLEELTGLVDLTFQVCRKVEYIDAVSQLESLERLNFSENADIASLKPIEPLQNLKELYFWGSTKIVDGDLHPLMSKTGLKRLAFANRRHYSHRFQDFEWCQPDD